MSENVPEHPHWGFIENGVFIKLPKLPLVRGGYGPPPFEITLSSGEVRKVVEASEDEPPVGEELPVSYYGKYWR